MNPDQFVKFYQGKNWLTEFVVFSSSFEIYMGFRSNAGKAQIEGPQCILVQMYCNIDIMILKSFFKASGIHNSI